VESRTHSVPFQVLKYCTIRFRSTAPKVANPVNALFFLLAIASLRGRSSSQIDHTERRVTIEPDPQRAICLRKHT
jgi:hypothetical protein